MKTIIEGIQKEIYKKKIDWNRVEEYVVSLGNQINFYNDKDEQTILSELYSSHDKSGYINEKLTELFIKHGFDVAANGGKNGASCLNALCWSSYDKYILHIAENLLNLGADSTISFEEELGETKEKGVLDSISWKLGYWNTGEYDSANMFTAYYEMVDRHQKGKKYQGIRAFMDAVGDTVIKVEQLEILNSNNELRTSYLLSCKKYQLIASDYVEFMVNPYLRDEAISIIDVSEEFKCIIGAKIKGLRYFNSTMAKLYFNNGYALLVGTNSTVVINEPKAWFKITTSDQVKLPRIGTKISSVKLWGSIVYSETPRFYRIETVVLNTLDGAYVLYSNGKEYYSSNIRVEGLENKLFSDLRRRINIHNAVLRHVEYSNDIINWIEVNCDEGVLYIKNNHFNELNIFMTAHEIRKSEVLNISSSSENLEKIKIMD